MSPEIQFSDAEKEIVIPKIKAYMEKAFNLDLGSFEAEFLMDFFSQEIGPYFYNRGVYEAQDLIRAGLEQIDETLYNIEKPTEFIKR